MAALVVAQFTYLNEYIGRADEVFHLAEIPVSSIMMPGFQRDRKQAHITKIAGEFDATSYFLPLVADFKNELLAIDGQQRLAALEKLEHETAVVALLEGVKTAERLAAIYLAVNRDRKFLDAFEKYVGALASKDRGTLAIARILSEFGLEANKSATGNGKVPAGAVTKIHEQGSDELLERVLLMREMGWGNTPCREANEGKTLLGLAQFLKRYGDKVDDERLSGLLRKHHPGYILSAIDKGQTVSYADYLREHYNKGLRGQKKL